MRIWRFLATLTVVLAAAGISAVGCEGILDPCSKQGEAATQQKNDKLLDGIWALTEINGAAIPPKGFPATPTDFLRAGSLTFRSRSIAGTCDDPTKAQGTVIARYIIGDGGAGLKPGKSASGDFTYYNKKATVTFQAFGFKYPGFVSNSRITVVGLHPDTFKPMTLVFTR